MDETGHANPLEAQVRELRDEVASLAARVTLLERAVEDGAAPVGPVGPATPAAVPTTPTIPAAAPPPRPLSLGRASTLLSRAATVCFLLVVALVLRTLAESGVFPIAVGSVLGIGYAAALTVLGWVLTLRRHDLATIFTLSGALLLGTVVLEAHARFGTVAAGTAYLLMGAAAVGTAVVGRRRGRALETGVVTAAAVVVGAFADFPRPYFPHLALLCLVLDAVAYAAPPAGRRVALRGGTLTVTLALWAAWTLRLNRDLYPGAVAPGNLAGETWFLPLLTAFAAFYLATSFREAVRRDGRLGGFDAVLPGLTACWTFAAALAVVLPGSGGDARVLGWIGTAVAAALVGAAVPLARRDRAVPAGTGAFAFAASALLTAALPEATGSLTLAVPALGAAAVGLSLLSRRWRSGGVRVTSYGLALAAGLYGTFSGALAAGGPAPWVPAGAAGLLAALGLLQYRWCRSHPPPDNSRFFTGLDRTDDTAVVLLLVSLVGAFLAVRVGIYEVLEGRLADLSNAFSCAQSILISLGGLGLMYAAFRRRDGEVRGVAFLVIGVAALKVFVYDLLGASGVPLVLSVFTFGVAASLAAMLLGRWQRPERGD